jgi:hypothetical protein
MFGISNDKSSNSRRNNENDQSLFPLLGNNDQPLFPLLGHNGSDKKNDIKDENRLYVKIKSGDMQEIEIDITDKCTVDDLKREVTSKLNGEGKRIRLIASGRLLDPGHKILVSDLKIVSGAFIHAVVTANTYSNDASITTPTVTGENFRGLDQLAAAGMIYRYT